MAGRRKLDDWLQSYLEYTEYTEPPVSYHVWSALSCISAALERKVYIDWEGEIYPNLYVILVGPAGRARKGTALKVAREFIKGAGIPMLGDDNSEEVIIKDMGAQSTTYIDKNGAAREQCAVACVHEELGVFTGYQNTRMLLYLTQWYDSRNEWSRRTKNMGIDELHGVCFNLLGATAPDWLPYIMPKETTQGGFTSRVIFVVEDDKGKVIADPTKHRPSKALKKDLAYDLGLIHNLVGEYHFDAEAHKACVEWYEELEATVRAGTRDFLLHPAFDSYLARKGTHIRKIGMAIAASRRDEPVITMDDYELAHKLLNAIEPNMPKVFTGIGKADYTAELEMILNYLRKAERPVKYSEILRTFYRDVADADLDAIMTALEKMKLVRSLRDMESREITYEYTGGDDPVSEAQILRFRGKAGP